MHAERGRGRKQGLPGAGGPQPPGDTARFDISQPAVSQHLATFTPDQKQNFADARYGWKMMGGKRVDLLARTP